MVDIRLLVDCKNHLGEVPPLRFGAAGQTGAT